MQHVYPLLPATPVPIVDRALSVISICFLACFVSACSDLSAIERASLPTITRADAARSGGAPRVLSASNDMPTLNASVGGTASSQSEQVVGSAGTGVTPGQPEPLQSVPLISQNGQGVANASSVNAAQDQSDRQLDQILVAGAIIPDRASTLSFTSKQADDQATKQPAAFVLEDWSDGRGLRVGASLIDNALPDLVFEDTDLHAEMGAVKLASAAKPIIMKGFEFGILRFTAAGLGESGGTLYQVLVAAKPYGTWSTYPYADTFDSRTNTTTPSAFKIRILNSIGAVIATLEMADGKPINDKSLSQTRELGTGALRPLFNVGMMLPWQSERPKISSKIKTFHPGFVPFKESRSKNMAAANGSLPMLSKGTEGRQQVNGYNHWYQLPKWPLESGAKGETNLDPYAYNVETSWSGVGPTAQSAWITGWDYEPGSISGHDWFTGPGGMRFDRATIPTPLAHLVSDPTYRRLKDGAPIREMVDSWGKAYFNHSGHYVTNLSTFNQILPTTTERRTNRQMGSYYGAGRTFAPLSKSIDMRGVTNGSYDLVNNNGGVDPGYFLDKNGNRFWNSWLVDSEHLHQVPYWHTILTNSPMHLVAARAAFNQSFLVRLGAYYIDTRPTSSWSPGNGYAGVNGRGQAYRWLHYTLMWKVATQNAVGLRRSDIEAQFLDELRNWHDTILVPTLAETRNPYHVAMKRLGVGVRAEQAADGWYLKVDGTSTQFYHAGTFMAMKNLGLWDKLRADPKAKAVLDFVAQTMTKFSADFMLDTGGIAEDESGVTTVAGPFATFAEITADAVPTWQQWGAKNRALGNASWMKDQNGQFREKYAAQHMRAQWTVMMRDWFPELDYPRIRDAAAMYETAYLEWQEYVDKQNSPREKSLADTKLLAIPYAFFQKPR